MTSGTRTLFVEAMTAIEPVATAAPSVVNGQRRGTSARRAHPDRIA
ncbi:MAG: hypothetical protein K8H88_27195 [Sandaracinaceae bacterium]|nr:hypothetical protein [Sandaracinaceae bacterium]